MARRTWESSCAKHGSLIWLRRVSPQAVGGAGVKAAQRCLPGGHGDRSRSLGAWLPVHTKWEPSAQYIPSQCGKFMPGASGNADRQGKGSRPRGISDRRGQTVPKGRGGLPRPAMPEAEEPSITQLSTWDALYYTSSSDSYYHRRIPGKDSSSSEGAFRVPGCFQAVPR